MKIITASNGKQTVKLSKADWENIGRSAGWMKTATMKTAAYQSIVSDGENIIDLTADKTFTREEWEIERQRRENRARNIVNILKEAQLEESFGFDGTSSVSETVRIFENLAYKYSQNTKIPEITEDQKLYR